MDKQMLKEQPPKAYGIIEALRQNYTCVFADNLDLEHPIYPWLVGKLRRSVLRNQYLSGRRAAIKRGQNAGKVILFRQLKQFNKTNGNQWKRKNRFGNGGLVLHRAEGAIIVIHAVIMVVGRKNNAQKEADIQRKENL